MTAKDLKNALLQEAVQGKLVPQIAAEGNARDLLEEIRKEKEILIKSGQMKKEKDLSEITENEIPFDIPENWCWCRLREICDTDISYGIIKLFDEDPSGVKVLRCSDVKYNSIDVSKVRTVTKELSEQYSRTVLKGGEIVINVRGTLGGCSLVPKTLCGFNVAREVAVIRTNERIEAQYIVYILLTSYFWLYMTNGLRGIAYKGLNMSTLSSLPIPLPPIVEQKRIVAAIKKFMPLIEEYGKKETVLNQLNAEIGTLIKKAILQEAFQGKLVPQDSSEGSAKDLLKEIKAEKEALIKEGKIKKEKPLPESTEDEIPFDIPENWCWMRLSDLCNMYTGDSINETEKKLKYTNVSDGWNYIGTKDVGFDQKITYDNGVKIPFSNTDFRIAPKDTVLMCIEGGSAGRKIAYTNQDVCFGNKLCCFNPFNKAVEPFLYFYLQSTLFTDAFKDNLTGIISGVSINTLKGMYFPLPPLSEQKRIVATIEQFLPLCEKLGQ